MLTVENQVQTAGTALEWTQDLQVAAVPEAVKPELAMAVQAYLDALATATARATYYNDQNAQIQATRAIHQRMLGLSREFYALMLGFDGCTDFNRQMAIELLLSTSAQRSAMTMAQENALLDWLLGQMPPQRVLKLFVHMRLQKRNGARARKLMLRWLLQADRIELWAVRYRRKLRLVIEHALGKRTSGIVRSILAKEGADAREQSILREAIGRYVPAAQRAKVYESVGFILGAEQHLTLPRLKAYAEARQNLEAGRLLPAETLEGLRSVYHKAVPAARVLELTKQMLTDGQKIAVQRKASETGVEVAFDPQRYSPLRLYLYAFEQGMSDEIAAALREKAQEAAQRLPLRVGRMGVLVDASASMWGDASQRLRPMASALALRDLLVASADRSSVLYVGGDPQDNLLYPQGATDLAEGLLRLVEAESEMIVILSDGYENCPAGRVAELMQGIRQIGVQTPVMQISPVLAAESGGIRQLAPGLITALPVAEPAALGLGLCRMLLEQDPVAALNGLLKLLPGDEIRRIKEVKR